MASGPADMASPFSNLTRKALGAFVPTLCTWYWGLVQLPRPVPHGSEAILGEFCQYHPLPTRACCTYAPGWSSPFSQVLDPVPYHRDGGWPLAC